MGEVAPKVGPVGLRVASRVKRIRTDRRLSVRELSARLTATGRPILPSGIVKLEQGLRRIDVDDLMALAWVLGVPVAELLGPRLLVNPIRQRLQGREDRGVHPEQRINRVQRLG